MKTMIAIVVLTLGFSAVGHAATPYECYLYGKYARVVALAANRGTDEWNIKRYSLKNNHNLRQRDRINAILDYVYEMRRREGLVSPDKIEGTVIRICMETR